MPNTNDPRAVFRLVLSSDRTVVAAGHATTVKALASIQSPQLPMDAPLRRPLLAVRRTWTSS